MPITLKVECPFDEKSETFTLRARLFLSRGEIMEHVFGTWKLTAKEMRFGRFTYSEFRLSDLSNPQEERFIGWDPTRANGWLVKHYWVEIMRFVARVFRKHGFRPSLYYTNGHYEVELYRIRSRPKVPTQSER